MIHSIELKNFTVHVTVTFQRIIFLDLQIWTQLWITSDIKFSKAYPFGKISRKYSTSV